MKAALFLSAFIALGGLAANPGHAQYFPTRGKTAAKPVSSNPAPVARSGSVGGPSGKPGGISGMAKKAPGVNGTVRPKY
jgi:hypothetical protein